MSNAVDATIESARCATCAYLIVGLSEPRCPECGAPFDPEYVDHAARSCLLPWERREMGGGLRRFGRTLRLACFSPDRYFECAAKRSGKRIGRPWLFLTGCIALSAGLCLVAYLFGAYVVFTGWFASYWTLRRIIRSSDSMAAPLFIPLGGKIVAVLVTAVLVRLMFRARLSALRTSDLAALFGPSIVVSATAWAASYVILCTRFMVFDFLKASFLFERCYWLVVIWFCGRRLLSRSWRNVVLLVILAGIADLSCRLADIWLVDPPLYNLLFYMRR